MGNLLQMSITSGQDTDSLSEKYYAISPYAYCAGNPVDLVDPEGMELYIHGKQSESALSQIQLMLLKKGDLV